MLWIPLVVAALLLYIFDIGGELRYRIAMPQSIIPSEYESLEPFEEFNVPYIELKFSLIKLAAVACT
jgi:hypothetical protein